MDSKSIDRRRHRRTPLRLPIRIATIDPEADPWTGRPVFHASRELTGNVSSGGVSMQTPDPLTPGRRLLIEVELPQGPPFEALGRVAWCRSTSPRGVRPDSRVGIEFVRAAPEHAARLQAFLGRSTAF